MNSSESGGTAIVCEDCGHVRETTEELPTLANCESCGSFNIKYRKEKHD